MNNRTYITLGFIFILVGLFISAYFNEWVIIRHPWYSTSAYQMAQTESSTTKKKVRLIFWRADKWVNETQEIIWPQHDTQAIYYLVNSWLTLLDDDAIMDKKVTLQTAIISPSGSDLYLSFDRNPLPTECSTFVAWMWVEGLLKTLRENGIHLQNVQFLVHHQPVVDDHLDFSNPWPLAGFFNL